MSEPTPPEDASVGSSDEGSIERNIIKSSAGPEPFPGIPQLPPRHPPEAGQVLLRFDVEEGHCWELTATGWCCFWSLLCTVPICCCLPCIAPCSMCHPRFQRPVYGYPIQCQIITELTPLPKGEAPAANGIAQDGTPLDESLQPEDAAVSSAPPTPKAAPAAFSGPLPSPRPQSIFVPPSAVPAIGFSIASPGYPRYKPEPHGGVASSAGGSAPSSAAGTPRSTLGGGSAGGGLQLRVATPSPLPLLSMPREGQPTHLGPPTPPSTQQQQHQHQHQQHTGWLSPQQSPGVHHPERGGLSPQLELEEEGEAPCSGPVPRTFSGRAAGVAGQQQRHQHQQQQHSVAAPRTALAGPRGQQQAASQDGTWGSRQNSRHISLDGATAASS